MLLHRLATVFEPRPEYGLRLFLNTGGRADNKPGARPYARSEEVDHTLTHPDTTTTPDAQGWARILSGYKNPSTGRGIFEITVTLLPLTVLWLAMWFALDIGYWLVLLLAFPAGAFLVRMFMIQHDCGHGAFFGNRSANDWTGRAIGVLTFTPYDFWQRTHAIHHATSGNLERRGLGDLHTLTLNEYRALSPLQKLLYRLYRNPLVMFGIGPAYLFILQHRLPVGLMREGWIPWASTMGTNVAIVLAATIVIWFIGFEAFLLVQLPIVLIAGTIGVWLFFVQHQFERTVWDHEENWNWHDAALRGSSFYDLPAFLRWLTASIGVHHVHHLSSRIPFYRLKGVLKDHPELRNISRLTLRDSLGCVRLVLWDETQRRLISFREAGAAA